MTGLVAAAIESYTLYDTMFLPPIFIPGEMTRFNMLSSTLSILTDNGEMLSECYQIIIRSSQTAFSVITIPCSSIPFLLCLIISFSFCFFSLASAIGICIQVMQQKTVCSFAAFILTIVD